MSEADPVICPFREGLDFLHFLRVQPDHVDAGTDLEGIRIGVLVRWKLQYY
jgi:hypothetical protein